MSGLFPAAGRPRYSTRVKTKTGGRALAPDLSVEPIWTPLIPASVEAIDDRVIAVIDCR
jgi:hypothetical protein